MSQSTTLHPSLSSSQLSPLLIPVLHLSLSPATATATAAAATPPGRRGSPPAHLGPRTRPPELLLPPLPAGVGRPRLPRRCSRRRAGGLRPRPALPRLPAEVRRPASVEGHGRRQGALRPAPRAPKGLRPENGRAVPGPRSAPLEAEGHAAAREAAGRRARGRQCCGSGRGGGEEAAGAGEAPGGARLRADTLDGCSQLLFFSAKGVHGRTHSQVGHWQRGQGCLV